ncbi:DUF1656 domain-containing protein [Metapseudomonas otitidis]|jgi:protein AaeX|uniref:DUF1656 domain-containing protein n=1 Tax=Metapseudomonas otitidis TaxID=319939 RepID=UPI00227C4A4C|nr:DUF1656 domain-containing protein [Pseudomonas otitidis]WAF87282.1 DUF1656 domain-containing protein [Pseudomonas otitidis]
MGLREWSLGGVLLSPLLIYALAALLVTGVLRLALQRLGLARWIWHEALFDTALYVCVLSVLVAAFGHW